MALLPTNIELQTYREATTLRMSNIEKFDDGSGYRCNLSVRSHRFAYDGPFYFDGFFVTEAIKGIRLMLTGEPGNVVIKGQWEDDAIRFSMNKLGHVSVSGLLLENAGYTQSLKFQFMTDQTVFNQLLRDLVALDVA